MYLVFFLKFTDEPFIHFLNIKAEILETKLAWLDSSQKGKWIKATDLNPAVSSNIDKKDLYSQAEKKKIKPTEACYTIYLKSNNKAKNVVNFLERKYNRKLKAVPYNGDCLFNSVLQQISHNQHRYTANTL